MPRVGVNICPTCKAKAPFDSRGDVSPHNTGYFALAICQACFTPAFVGAARDGDRQPSATDWRVLYPPARDQAPEELPGLVRRSFTEALRSLNIGNDMSAVVMARSALQACTRQLGGEGKSLYHEIEGLAKAHKLPLSIQEWAHEIRKGALDGAHPTEGEDVSSKDAEELILFAESVFEYVYVIPARVEERRKRLAGN